VLLGKRMIGHTFSPGEPALALRFTCSFLIDLKFLCGLRPKAIRSGYRPTPASFLGGIISGHKAWLRIQIPDKRKIHGPLGPCYHFSFLAMEKYAYFQKLKNADSLLITRLA